MKSNPLKSLDEYSRFIAKVFDHSIVKNSTITTWSVSKYTGIAEGEVFFVNGYRLRIREELDFDAGLITSYGYEVYQGDDKLYWYDDFPHPNDDNLVITFPHHKHIKPDIKHNRIPASNIRFSRPNLPELIKEINELISQG